MGDERPQGGVPQTELSQQTRLAYLSELQGPGWLADRFIWKCEREKVLVQSLLKENNAPLKYYN